MLSRKTDDRRQTTDDRLSGFSLLELLIVLAIMALFTAMSAPAISGYLRGARLRGGAQQIASALRQARQLAITKRAVYSVDFNADPLSTFYRQFWVEWNNLNPGMVDTLVGEVRTLPDTIDFDPLMKPPAPPPLSYNFTARGTVGGGSIFIVDPRGSGREIIIAGATGRIKIE